MLRLPHHQPRLPILALPDRDIALEHLLQLRPQCREFQVPPGSQLLVQPLAGNAEIGKPSLLRSSFKLAQGTCVFGDLYRERSD
jgi:hypothetical protein